jgi:ketosteroid isomerase-like protein
MNRYKTTFVKSTIILLTVLANATYPQKATSESDLNSMVNAERAFARASVEKNTRDAFIEFIAEDGILFRPHAVNGKKYLEAQPVREGLLNWWPSFADISRSNDLGYTTGPWEASARRDGKPESFGHFMTVWKKQADGAWKWVIDLGISHPRPGAKEEFKAAPASPKPKPDPKANVESERAALLDIDREMSRLSAEKGAVAAFAAHLSDDARISRDGEFPAVGRQAARNLLAKKNGSYTWQPAGGDVSRAADLGYTYGIAELKAEGAAAREYFNYLRIWKKQPGGRWRVVLDVASPAPPPAN